MTNIVIAIVALVGAFICAFWFVSALAFPSKSVRQFSMDVVLSLIGSFCLMAIFFWALNPSN